MRRSEFDRAVTEEFGDVYGTSLLRDLALGGVGHRTGAAALRDGVPPREVWFALCREMDVPPERHYGAGRLDPKRS
ncbi:DUF3046 domain-containing protein [Pseudoclavibacter endophyticus]|uniref:DUF3046 domain-containing protein n=1 Tax=Pseudoclavibacter endophyticus TaxID=1778590 RepID=A0A6H9WME4_9MICO|nr:DUF3046 domain-containing protein [Pseudoclavibacter endophyticus]KAB1646920.1 DUF3046 domain-containing protein [Pseudoclavibacter endophyticus]